MEFKDINTDNIETIDEKQVMRIIDGLRLNETIDLEDIPNLDLYMDQVITLFEDKLSHTKRYDEDKLLTKTMINNYTKDRLLMPVKKKKYTREHILLMILLYELKQILSISDIKDLFNIVIIDGVVNTSKLETIYEIYLALRSDSVSDFKEEVKTINNNINAEIKKAYSKADRGLEHKLSLEQEITHIEETSDNKMDIGQQTTAIKEKIQGEVADNKDDEQLLQEIDKTEDVLTVVMLIQKANYYKKLAEKIIDERLK